MSIIERNDYGAIAVNKVVLERMIIEDILEMGDDFLLSDHKGRPIKEKPTPFIDPDYFDAVDVSDKKGTIRIKVYIAVRSGKNISAAAESIFDAIGSDFDLLKMERPENITVKVRGIIDTETGETSRRNIDVVRNNS